MPLTNPNKVVTEERLSEFYGQILPYLGGASHTLVGGAQPIGSIIPFMGTVAPSGTLACDGTVYNIADYPDLANFFNAQFGQINKFGGNGTTTFAVPDLRGEFLRGTGTNSHTNQGSGANVGEHQDATEHILVSVNAGTDLYTGTRSASGQPISSINRDTTIYKGSTTAGLQPYVNTSGGNGDASSHYTSKPTNTSVLWCIQAVTENITVNVTVYSAVSDTITYIDILGEHTVNTDNTGKAENVAITVLSSKPIVTLWSTIATDPEDLSKHYSKTFTIGTNISELYLMPENTFYWYGNFIIPFIATDTRMSPAGGTRRVITTAINTNNIILSDQGTPQAYQGSYISNGVIDVTNLTKCNILVNSAAYSNTYGSSVFGVSKSGVSAITTDQYSADAQKKLLSTVTPTVYYADITNITGDTSIYIFGTAVWQISVSAIWLD